MADEGTLATTAEVLLAIGENAEANQILEANTNIWIKWAEGEMSGIAGVDLVTNYGSVTTIFKRFLAAMAANRAATYGINQSQNTWQLATSQSKLNVFDSNWRAGVKVLEKQDMLKRMGLSRT